MNPPFGTGITFKADGPNRWRGDVIPLQDTSTFYLMLQKRPDGSVGAFLRNREFNLGVRYNLDRLVRDGNAVRVIGRLRGETAERVLLNGHFEPATKFSRSRSIRRSTVLMTSGERAMRATFIPAPGTRADMSYQPPLARSDGWQIATVDEANIDRKGIENFVQWILDMPMDSVETPQVDGILIARHGKLVVEEYFHGSTATATQHALGRQEPDRDPDRRGHAGRTFPSASTSPVYQVMNGGRFPEGLEPRKRAMTLEHLLTMTSGFFCDDGNPDAPGNEDTMTDQSDEPDFYRFNMAVPMDREPGRRSGLLQRRPQPGDRRSVARDRRASDGPLRSAAGRAAADRASLSGFCRRPVNRTAAAAST